MGYIITRSPIANDVVGGLIKIFPAEVQGEEGGYDSAYRLGQRLQQRFPFADLGRHRGQSSPEGCRLASLGKSILPGNDRGSRGPGMLMGCCHDIGALRQRYWEVVVVLVSRRRLMLLLLSSRVEEKGQSCCSSGGFGERSVI